MDKVAQYLKALNPFIKNDDILKVASISSLKDFKKGEIIIPEGEVSKKYYFILSGLVRKYTIDNKGKERIRGFYKESNLFSPTTSLMTKEKNKHIFDCLKDCELLEFDYNKYMELCTKNIQLSRTYAKSLELGLIDREQRIYELTELDATERYLKLKKDFPNLENLVAQYHIASYLNITPTQLSRIRKKLYSK